MDMATALATAARKARTNPREVIQHLDRVSRSRALTDQESRDLEKAIRAQSRSQPSTQTAWCPALDRRVIALVEEGKTFAEIGAALALTRGAVMNRYYRIRQGKAA